jgi:hypothetical protein
MEGTAYLDVLATLDQVVGRSQPRHTRAHNGHTPALQDIRKIASQLVVP